jgi:hypothetical protein
MTKNSYSPDEAMRIITTAKALQVYAHCREGLTKEGDADLEYLAETEGVSEEYLNKAERMLYPSLEERAVLWGGEQAKLTCLYLVRLYARELTQQLRMKLPWQEFTVGSLRTSSPARERSLANFYKIETKKRIFWGDKKIKTQLAQVEIFDSYDAYELKLIREQLFSLGNTPDLVKYQTYNLELTLFEESFLHICQDTFQALNQLLKEKGVLREARVIYQ